MFYKSEGFQKFWKESKTVVWTSFWLALAFFVDTLSQALVGISLPTVNIDLSVFKIPMVIPVNTALVVGIVVNRLSKYLHDRNEKKKIEEALSGI